MMQEKRGVPMIFLSHHSSTVQLAAHLARYLEKNGLNAWYAPKDIRSGEQWDEAILNAIKACQAVVLLFCAQADSSRQIKRELSLADKYKKPVFWLRVERVEPNNLSYFLTSTQWLDWLDTRDDTLETLVHDIWAVERGRPAPQPEKDRPAPSGEQPAQNTWAKGVLAFETDRQAAECAARVYFAQAGRHPDASVILPTGRSATALFRAMVRLAESWEGCPFGEAHLITDTETFGVWSGHESSRTRHVQEMLLDPLKRMGKAPDSGQLHLLSGIYMEGDPVKNAQKVIRMFPPSIHAVSVSPLGEILAYEVGTYNEIDEIVDDAPRILEVGEHSKKYIDPNQPSKSILSVGMGTALSADILLILIFDLQKAGILRRLFTGPVTAGIPATLLRTHPNAFVLTTEKTALEARIEELCQDRGTPEEAAAWIVSR